LVEDVGEESVMATVNVELVRHAYQAYADGDQAAMLAGIQS
jgi:ketosteroid isomerase-like protein